MGLSGQSISIKSEMVKREPEMDYSLFSTQELWLVRAAERLQLARVEGGPGGPLRADVRRFIDLVEQAA
jgi:hypothetical protein